MVAALETVVFLSAWQIKAKMPPQQSNGNVDKIEQNLPTSFDVSALIAKLKQHESELSDVIQRVRISELEPYKNDKLSPQEETRLFLAVAY